MPEIRVPEDQPERTPHEAATGQAGVPEGIHPETLRELLGELSKQCHKINNPLTSIMGRAQMMEARVKQGSDEQLAKSVAVIQDSTKRVAGLIQELANLVCQARKELVETYDSKSGSR